MLISNNYNREIFDYDCMLEVLLIHFYIFYRNKDTLYTQCISDFKGLVFKIQKTKIPFIVVCTNTGFCTFDVFGR